MYQTAFEIKHYFDMKACIINDLNSSAKREQIMEYLINEYPKFFLTKRKLEKMKSPVDIVFYLEKHHLVNVRDVFIFRQIADMLQISDLSDMVMKHEHLIATSTLRSPKYWDDTPSPPAEVQENIEKPDKKSKIYEIVSLEIGQSWRDLARNLSIREGELDVLHHKHPEDLKTKVYTILDIFSNREPREWSTKLAQALHKSRRVDLQTKVLNIMAT